ncbi:hypothetical protein ACVWW1_000385 [Bradyrhizobium sp. JR3.5]
MQKTSNGFPPRDDNARISSEVRADAGDVRSKPLRRSKCSQIILEFQPMLVIHVVAALQGEKKSRHCATGAYDPASHAGVACRRAVKRRDAQYGRIFKDYVLVGQD